MQLIRSDRIERSLFLLFGWAIAVVPVVYFHNDLVTEYYFSKTIWANLFIPLSVGLLAFFMLRDERIAIPRAWTLLPLMAFSGWALLSISWATNPYKSFELLGKIGIGPVAYVGTLYFLRGRNRIQGALYLITWTMVGVAIYGYFQYFEVFYLPKDQYGEADPSTTIGLTNFVVEFMMPFLMVPLLLAFTERRRWVKMLLIFSASILLVYLIVSRNRAGMLGFLFECAGLVLVLGIAAWRMRDRFRIQPKQAMAVAAAVVIVLAGILGGTTVGKRVSARFLSMFEETQVEEQEDLGAMDAFLQRIRRDASIRFRLETWYQCLKNMFPDNPVTGVGLANLEVEFPRYYTRFLEGMTIRNNTRVVRSHNEYVQVLIDLGYIGFVLFAWLLVQLIRNAYVGFRRTRERRELLLWMAINLGFLGVAVEMFFAFPLQVPSSSIFFFIAMALSENLTRALKHRAEDAPEAPAVDERDFHLFELKPAWKLSAGYAALAIFSLAALRLEVFSYDALVGEVRNKEARVYKRYAQQFRNQARRGGEQAQELKDRGTEYYQSAYKLLSDGIEHYPYMEGYYYDRAVVLIQLNKLEDGLKDLQQTAHLVPNYAMGRKQIGMLASELGRTELAIEEFKATMRIYGSQRQELTELIAQTALRGNEAELAVPVLEETIAMGEGNPKLLRLLADAYLVVNEPAKALETFEQLKDEGQWDAGTRANYGMALLRTGKVTEAEAELRELTTANPGYDDGWFALGKVLMMNGKFEAAKEALARAAALDPANRRRIKRDPTIREHEELRNFLKSL